MVSSNRIEKLMFFSDIMKLVPSFKEIVIACSDHRRALVNLIRMVSSSCILKYHIWQFFLSDTRYLEQRKERWCWENKCIHCWVYHSEQSFTLFSWWLFHAWEVWLFGTGMEPSRVCRPSLSSGNAGSPPCGQSNVVLESPVKSGFSALNGFNRNRNWLN